MIENLVKIAMIPYQVKANFPVARLVKMLVLQDFVKAEIHPSPRRPHKITDPRVLPYLD
tara:strand:- start:135 stop:311 length:177 start_codon:yes stop_codon:yes gene_type:complete